MQKDQKVQLAVPQLEWRVFTAVTSRGNLHNSGQRPADRPTTRDNALRTGPQHGTAPCGPAHNTGQRPGVCTLWNSSLLLCTSKGVCTLWNSSLSLCTSKGVCTLWNSGLLLCTWKGVGTLWNSGLLLCTSTSVFYCAPAPQSFTVHQHLSLLLCTSTSVFYCAPAPQSFTVHQHLSLLLCTSTSVFYCAPAPQSVHLLCETSVFYRAFRNVLFVRHHVLFVRHHQNARVPCATSVVWCALGNNSSFLLVCYLVSHCENHSLVQLSGQCTLAKIRSARWNSIVETQQSQSKNRWRSIAEWEVAEETRRAGLGMSIASSVLWPSSLSSMTIVSLAKVT